MFLSCLLVAELADLIIEIVKADQFIYFDTILKSIFLVLAYVSRVKFKLFLNFYAIKRLNISIKKVVQFFFLFIVFKFKKKQSMFVFSFWSFLLFSSSIIFRSKILKYTVSLKK
jgi:hypothetical protein